MEKYCTTLAKSKELVASGWKKETKFWWFINRIVLPGEKRYVIGSREMGYEHNIVAPACLAAEILEELNNDTIIKYISEIPNNEEICLGCIIMNLLRSPDALADCWIWAKKNGLIK